MGPSRTLAGGVGALSFFDKPYATPGSYAVKWARVLGSINLSLNRLRFQDA